MSLLCSWHNIVISNNVGGVKDLFEHTAASARSRAPSLTMSAVSRTFSSTLQHRLGVERHFALVEICQANLGLASNRCASRTQSNPTISSSIELLSSKVI